MPISTNGTVIARLAGGLYNTVLSNATYLEVATQDPSTLANTLYSRDFAKSTDLSVATTLLANLGLSAEAGLDAWVAAQLTAAGAANKGAKIVSLLNDFAGLTADAKWGTYATSFNTKVDAALAASQKDAAVTGVFATAGSVAVANATFTLTTSTDAFVGGAGNDTFNATVATLGALDTIDGGAGANTLKIVDSASIASQPATVTNVQTLSVNSTAGAVGSVAAAAVLAAKQQVTYYFDSTTGPTVGTGPVKVTVGGVSKTVVNSTATNAVNLDVIAAAIDELLDAGVGAATWATGTAASTGTIVVTAATAGTALPTITIAKGTYTPNGGTEVANTTLSTTANTGYTYTVTNQANQVATAATTASTFTAPTGVTSVDITAATDAFVASKTTANTVVTAGGVVKLATAADATVTAGDSVQVSGATGAVVIGTGVPTVDLAAVSYTGWSAAPGVFVRNGTTVKITETAGTSTSGGAATGNATAIQVGANPTSASGTATSGSDSATRPTSSSTNYPDVVGNLSSAPKGDVTIEVKTPYTNTTGYKAVTYGTGDVTVYMNGGTTASVTGANDVTITDLQSTLLLSSATATAAPGTSKLSTVNVTGLSAVSADTSVVTIKSDAVTNLSIVDSATTVNVTGNTGANATALNVSVGNSTATVSAGNATSVAVTGVTSAYEASNGSLTAANNASTLTLTTAKAKTLSFSGASDVTLSGSTLTALTGVTSTSTKKVALGDVSGLANLTSIDASGASGALTATIGTTSDNGLTVTGGAGGDTVTLAASSTLSARAVSGGTVKTTVNLGAGNDKFLAANASSSVVDTGAVIDGGDGTDTVQAVLVNSGNAAIFKNFETIDLKSSTGGGSFDASLLTGSTISGVAFSGKITASGGSSAYAVTKLAGTAISVTNSTLTDDVGSLTATLASSTGTADTATVTFAATAASATSVASMADFITSGIESLSVASGGTIATVGHKVTNTLTKFTDTSNTTSAITISGIQKFVLGGVDQSTVNAVTPLANITAALKTIDASANTGGVDITAGADTADVSSTTYDVKFTGLTITGGTGADTIRNDALGGVTNGGDGADTLKVYGGATAAGVQSTANGGAGNDTISVNAAVSATLTGGAGRDTFDVSAAKGTVTSGVVTTITDFSSADDTIKVTGVTGFAKATTLTGSYSDLLGAAKTQVDGNSIAAWFQFDGNTFVVADVSGANDVAVVKLVGLYTLTTLTASSAATGLIGEA